jgi:hypothetical protein
MSYRKKFKKLDKEMMDQNVSQKEAVRRINKLFEEADNRIGSLRIMVVCIILTIAMCLAKGYLVPV